MCFFVQIDTIFDECLTIFWGIRLRNQKTIRVSQLNIAMDSPHSPQGYVDLMRHAKKLDYFVRLRGDEAVKLGPVDFKNWKDNEGYVFGDIYRFLNIDEDAQWFNTEKNLPATVDETEEINIPPALRPNLRTIRFVFRPKGHTLFFVNKDGKDTMTPQQAEKFFQELFERVCAKSRFPGVTVTAIPEKNSIDAIFRLPTIKRIEIKLTRPNPDDFESRERRLKRRLERLNAKRIETILVAQPGKNLEPDEEIKGLAEVAAKNGSVVARGVDAHGRTVIESTKNRPIDEPYEVDLKIQDSRDVLLEVSKNKV